MRFKKSIEKLRNFYKAKSSTDETAIEDLTKDDYKLQIQGYRHQPSIRIKANEKARAILQQLEQENRFPTVEEIEALKEYTGEGALSGSDDEYYTPEYLANSTWDMMGDLGADAKVLDPSSGTGIFDRNSPENVTMQNIEYNSVSAKITDLTNDTSTTIHSSFEVESYNIEPNSLDGVITNVPFGMRDKKLDTNKRFDDVTKHEHYFVMRSLELLKAGKRAVFIMPSSFLTSKQYRKAKLKILQVGSFVGGVKLPNKVFSHSGANVCTDIVVFEKHPLHIANNIQERRYSPTSIESTIYEDENNQGFLNGKYFETNKLNVLGRFIKSDDFQDSDMFDGHSRKDQCITTDSMDEIKDKIAKATKTKFVNTVVYEKLEALSDDVIVDEVQMQQMEKDIAELRDFSYILREKGTLTVAQLKDLIKVFNKLVNDEKSTILKVMDVHLYLATSLYFSLSKKNYKNVEIIKYIKVSMMLKSIDGSKITNKKMIANIQEDIEQVTYISDKSNTNYLKFSKDFLNHDLHNSNIKIIYNRLSNGMNTSWDFDKNEPLNNSLDEIKTFHSLFADKGLVLDDVAVFNKDSGAYEFDNIDNQIFTADEILDNKEIFLMPNGKLAPKGEVLFNGAELSDIEAYLEDLQYDDKLGLTKEQFDEKLQSTKKVIKPHLESIDINTLKLNQYNVTAFLPESAFPRITVIKQQTLKDRVFLFIGSGANVIIEEATDIVKSTFGVNQFFKRDDDDRDFMFQLYGDEIKEILGVVDSDNFNNRVREYSTKSAEFKKDYLNKIRHIVHKHNSRELSRYNIAIDTKVKNDKLLSGLLRENINKNNRISLDQNETSGRLNQMNEFVNTNILDTNHDYQNTDISNFSDSMSGIIAQDTGLGKTRTIVLTALNVVLKKKAERSLIVVPTSIFDKWKMSVSIGEKAEDGSWKEEPIIREDQKELIAYVSNEDKSSWNKLKTNKKARVVIMTSDAFKTLTFKSETLKYLEGDSKKEREAKGGKNVVYPKLTEFKDKDWKMASETKNSIGYFEEANIGFLIVDEAQDGKNSLTGGKQFKFGSSLKGSYYGNRLALVGAILRDVNGGAKGIVYATATPFTSSPYEIYTMLKNSGGLKNCKDLETFQEMFFITNERYEDSVIRDGEQVKVNVFEGLTNLSYLRQVGLNGVEYRSVETESKRNDKLKSIKPDYTTTEKIAEVTTDIVQVKTDLVERYELSRELVKEKEDDSIDEAKVELMRTKFNLDFNSSDDALKITKISSSFGTIDKLSKLAINKDFAYDKMVFNLKGLNEEQRLGLMDNLLKKTVSVYEMVMKRAEDGSWTEIPKKVKYTLADINNKTPLIDGDILTIPLLDSAIADFIIKGSDGASELLDIEDYPKYKLLLENIQDVLYKNSRAKQLVFSLNLTGAKVIQYFVAKLFKDLKVQVKIMSSLDIKVKKTDEEDLGEKAKFQQEYNNEQSTTVLIFTKAFSKGVDFNILTVAVHLVDIPYSPDVWHQAMGRGVRQGNKIENVEVFTYSQGGTVDTFKLKVLSEKSTWQEELSNTEINDIRTASVNTEEVMAEAIKKFGGNATDEQIQEVYDLKTEAVKDTQKEEQEDKNDFLYDEAIEKIKLATYSNKQKKSFIENKYEKAPDTGTQLKQLDSDYKPRTILTNVRNKGKLKNRIWHDIKIDFSDSVEETIAKINDYDLNNIDTDRAYSYLPKLTKYVKTRYAPNEENKELEKLTKYIESVTKEVKDEMLEYVTEFANIEQVKSKAIEEVINTSTNQTHSEVLKDIKSGANVMIGTSIYSKDEVIQSYIFGKDMGYSDETEYFKFEDKYFQSRSTEYAKFEIEPTAFKLVSKKDSKYTKAKDNFDNYKAKMNRLFSEHKEYIDKYFDGKEPTIETYNNSITDLSTLFEVARAIEEDEIIEKSILNVEDFLIEAGRYTYMKKDNKIYTNGYSLRIRSEDGYDYIDTSLLEKIEFDTVISLDEKERANYQTITQDSDYSLFEEFKTYPQLQETIRDGLVIDTYEYVSDGKSLYYPVKELIEFIEEKLKAEELAELVNSDDKYNMSKDDLVTFFHQGEDSDKKAILDDIKSGKYLQLKVYKDIIATAKTGTGVDTDYWTQKADWVSIYFDAKLNLIITGAYPKKGIRYDGKSTEGVRGSKNSVFAYNNHGDWVKTEEWIWNFDNNYEYRG